MADLPQTLTGLQQALQRGDWSVAQALQAQRDRMQQRAAALHCVVQHLPQSGAENEAAAAANTGVLAGIGVAHKDIFDLAGCRPGVGHDHGCPAPGRPAAAAVARLAQHGAEQLATLTLAEFACGATAANPRFPRCVNPLRPQAVVGGSSGGSAVAVAAQLAYASLGTDTAGSVRIPAATCGVLGLKTTHGSISRDGVHPLAPSLDGVGILTRSAADTRQLLDVLVPAGGPAPPPGTALRLRAWIPSGGVDAEVLHALEDLLREYIVVERSDTWAEFAQLTRRADTVLHVEAARTHGAALRDDSAAAAVREVALAGVAIPADWYEAALADRGRSLRQFVQQQLEGCDVLLLPALAGPVPDWSSVTAGDAAFDAHQLLGLYRYMGFANYLGVPSIVVPIARDSRGMPISVQAVARPFAERSLLAFAETVQARRFDGAAFTRLFHPGD